MGVTEMQQLELFRQRCGFGKMLADDALKVA
jgi:hypothetical protein